MANFRTINIVLLGKVQRAPEEAQQRTEKLKMDPLSEDIQTNLQKRMNPLQTVISAAMLLAITTLASACYEIGNIDNYKVPGDGQDTDTINFPIVDTEGGPNALCGEFDGTVDDNEAVLKSGDGARLTVEGHEMEVDYIDEGSGSSGVYSIGPDGTILWEEPAEMEEGTSITFEFGAGIDPVEVVFCGLIDIPEPEPGYYNGPEPGTNAWFVSTADFGFVHCSTVSSGSTQDAVHVVYGSVEQTVTVHTHADGEWGDPECSMTNLTVKYEVSVFDSPFSTNVMALAGMGPAATFLVGGDAWGHFSEVSLIQSGVGDNGPFIWVGLELDYGELSAMEAVSGNGLTAYWTGAEDSQGRPIYAYSYAYTGAIYEEDTAPGEKTINILNGGEITASFLLRYEDGDIISGAGTTLLTDVQLVEQGAQITIDGTIYNVEEVTSAESGPMSALAITGWRLAPAIVE